MAQSDWQINTVYSLVPNEGLSVPHNSLSEPLSGSEFGDYCRYFRTDQGGSIGLSGFTARLKNPAALSIPDTKAISVRSWVRISTSYTQNYAFIFVKDYCGSCWNNSDSRSGYHFGLRYGDFYLSAKGHTLMTGIDANPILGYNTLDKWVHLRLDVIPLKHNGVVIIDHLKAFVEVDGVWQLVTERYIEATDSEFVPWQTSTPSYVGFGAFNWYRWMHTWWDNFEVFTETVEQPESLTLALTNDTGASNQDKITSDPSVAVSEPEVGAVREYSVDLANWSSSIPTFTSGSNVLYARQVNTEGRTSPISTLEFTYIPDDSYITITSAATASVVENSGESQVIYTAAAENVYSTIKYNLKEVNDYQKFSIDTISGQVTLLEDPNFEISSSYSFTFEAEDLAGFTKEHAVVLSVLDQNEAPSFQLSFNNGTQLNPLAENTAIDYVVATLSATDPENDTVTFSLVSQTVDGTFALSSSSLVLTGSLDYETNSSHVVTLRAYDGEFNVDQTYNVHIGNINETPVLTVEMVAGTLSSPLAEDSAIGTTVANLSATDEDGDSLEFSIVSQTVAGMFAISGNSLVLDSSLDYETNQSHTVVVRVSDGIINVDQSHTIYISDVNESPSVTLTLLTGSQSQPLSEDAELNTVVGTFTTSDQEGDSVVVSIASQTVGGTFAISGSSLVLTGALDYETNATHTVTLRASDGVNNTDQNHTIYIGNINDTAPSISLSLDIGSLEEPVSDDSSIGLVLGTLSATDAEGDSVTFNLVNQTVAGTFEISGSSLKLAGTLDYNANASHTLTIEASDGLNSAQEEYTVHVALQAGAIITSGLQLHLDAGDTNSYPGSGTTWYDLSGNGNDATLQNGVVYSSANEGILTFDGVDDYISTEMNPNLDNNRLYTYELWFNDESVGVTDGASTNLISNYGFSNTVPFSGLFIRNNGTCYFIENNSANTESYTSNTPSIVDGTWKHLVAVAYENKLSIFINGVLSAESTSRPGGQITSGQNLLIGSGHSNRYQSCDIASVRLYLDKALSEAEVLHNYNATKERFFGVVTSGLQLHLDAGDTNSYPGSGTTWYDLSGNGNDATLQNGVAYSSANEGTLTFDGVDDYVRVANPYKDYTNEITVEWWTKRNGNLPSGAGWGLSQENVDNALNIFFLMHANSDNTITFYVRDPSASTLRSLNIGTIDTTPSHFVGTINSSSIKVYKNGVLVSTGPGLSGNMVSYSTPVIHLGKDSRYPTGRFYNGNIYSARLYNRALSEAEVLQNYNATKERFPVVVTDGLQLHLDAGDTNSYPGSGTTWYDLSGNGNNGTLLNGVGYSSANGGSLTFDGSNDYVSIPYNSNSMNFSSAQTICMWLKPGSGATNARRNPYNQAYGGSGTITHEQSGVFSYYFGTNGGNGTPYVGRGTSFTVGVNELAFIVVTRDQATDTVKWYKNGQLEYTATAGGYSAVANSSAPILIGAGYVNNFVGQINVTLVYNRALTEAEVLQNFNVTKDRFGL